MLGEGCKEVVAFYLPVHVVVEGWSRWHGRWASLLGGGEGFCYLIGVCDGKVVGFEGKTVRGFVADQRFAQNLASSRFEQAWIHWSSLWRLIYCLARAFNRFH